MKYTEVKNEHGFFDCLDESALPCCSSCHACVAVNRGQGTVCDTCYNEFLAHCEADYD